MALFVTEHTHPGESCPANDPAKAQGLLAIVNPANASRAGITIRADAVTNGQHHLYLVVEAPGEAEVRNYFAPFGQFGTLRVSGASHCEQVVARGRC